MLVQNPKKFKYLMFDKKKRYQSVVFMPEDWEEEWDDEDDEDLF